MINPGILSIYFIDSAASAAGRGIRDDTLYPAVRACASLPLLFSQNTSVRGQLLSPVTASVVDVCYSAHVRGENQCELSGLDDTVLFRLGGICTVGVVDVELQNSTTTDLLPTSSSSCFVQPLLFLNNDFLPHPSL